jgi:hypothetical protein
MPHFVAFGVGFGNVGVYGTRHPPMSELVTSWNERWEASAAGARIVHTFHKTGNFVLDLEHGGLTEAVAAFRLVASTDRFAVFPVSTFRVWLASAREAARRRPPVEAGRRWTPGVVMNLALDAPVPPRPPLLGVIRFGEEAQPRLRFAWKHDLLKPGSNVLDPMRREGGWGAVAKAMQTHAAGVWTARALSSVEGLIAFEVTDFDVPEGSGLETSRAAPDRVPLRQTTGTALVASGRDRLEPTEPHLVVMAARRAAEQWTRQVCQRAGVDVSGKRFLELCHEIESRRLLGPKAVIALHTLRRLGNLAAHAESGVEFTVEDSELVTKMLRSLPADALNAQ